MSRPEPLPQPPLPARHGAQHTGQCQPGQVRGARRRTGQDERRDGNEKRRPHPEILPFQRLGLVHLAHAQIKDRNQDQDGQK